MLQLLHRLYERDVGSGRECRTLSMAILLTVASLGLLAVISGLPISEAYTAEGTLEPSKLMQLYNETDGAIRLNLLELGKTYEPGAPVVVVTSGADASRERIYTAPCRCMITHSKLLRHASGPLRAGELIAEFIDTTSAIVRFPVVGRQVGAVKPGLAVYVVHENGSSMEGIVEGVYPRRARQLGLEAVAALPTPMTWAPGSRVRVKLVASSVPLWRFFVEDFRRRKE